MSAEVIIRSATVNDAKDLLAIYAHYVTNTAISFEYDVPTVEEFANRIAKILQKYPYLVAVVDGKIVGYAYAAPLKTRAAYIKSVELSIYIDRSFKGQGIGGKLYQALSDELNQIGIANMYACIAYSEAEDEYLNHDSIKFHERMGFKVVGHFNKCGYKFGRYYDVLWMEKIIGKHE